MSERLPVVNVDELDPHFISKIMKQPGGKNIITCFQCGTCVASCPIRAIEGRYNPRRIIKMAFLGMKHEILSNPFIWICSTCLVCQERCPQDVKLPDVMNAIKNIAVEGGIIPDMYKELKDKVRSHDRIYLIDEFIEVERENLGLPKIVTNLREVKKLVG